MNKKILITYAYMVKHGGASRVLSEIINRSQHASKIELLYFKNDFSINHTTICHVIKLPHDDSVLSFNESSLFSKGIKEKYSSSDYLLHSFGVYDILPDIYSAHFCVAECFDRLHKSYDEAVVTAHYPDWQEIVKMEKNMILGSPNCKIISVSKQLADEMKKHYGHKGSCTHIIPNASRFEDYTINKRIKLKANQPIKIGFIGKELLRKGFFSLVKALDVIAREYEIYLIIAGCKSKIVKQYLNMSSFQVEILGEIEIQKSFYHSLDLFICPSIYEPFSLTTVEAMSLQVPTIFSKDIGLFGEISQNHKKDLLVLEDPTSVECIINMIRYALLNEDVLEQSVNIGKEVSQAFSWQRSSEAYDNIWNAMIH